MPDWFERIATIISEDEAAVKESVTRRPTLLTAKKNSVPPFKEALKRGDFSPSFSGISSAPKTTSSQDPSTSIPSSSSSVSDLDLKDEKTTMKNKTENNDNLKTLKRLRELPRGTQVESRIAAIKNLLGENEIFKTL